MNYSRKYEFLPKKLVLSIKEKFYSNSTYEYRTKNNFLKCIGIIYEKQLNDYHSMIDYIETGSSYWKTVYGNDYHKKVILPLINMEIIQSYDFGYRKELIGIRYRINPLLTEDECEIILYINKGKVISAEECVYNESSEFLVGSIDDKNLLVSINNEKAINYIKHNAEKICKDYMHPEYIQYLPEKLIIEYHECIKANSVNTRYYNSVNVRYGSIESAKLIAESRNEQLFFFKDKFYIANIQAFLEVRIPSLIYHYKRQISKVGVIPLTYNRNITTLRMHNYLVNFPSKILQFININSQTVVQLDLQTSQFLLFANLLNTYIINGETGLLTLFKNAKTKNYLKRLITVLKEHKSLLPAYGVDINDHKSNEYNSSDVSKFIHDVFFQDFYTIVQKELGLPERKIAKLLLFKLLFKKSNKRDALVDKLLIRYPVIMSIIADFKKPDKKNSKNKNDVADNRESNFSVFLQCVESEIFIDNILLPLLNKGIPCFTRHDSVVVASSYADEVEKYAKDVFQRFGFKYNFKVEDKLWESVDFEEIEDSTYMDWLIDENELNNDFYIEEDNVAPNEFIMEQSEEESLKNEDMIYQYQLNDIADQLVFIDLPEVIKDDYSDDVGLDELICISYLECLSFNQRQSLEDDIANLQSNYPSPGFNEITNRLIQWLVQILN
jgi:hypothetical protein